jgi:hypothetical protein
VSPRLSSTSTTLGQKSACWSRTACFSSGVFDAPAQYVEQIKVLVGNAPGGADAEIAELSRLVGGVPALHEALKFHRQLVLCVMPKPGCLDEAAAQRSRGLPVLAGDPRNEVSGGLFADRLADPLDHRQRLVRRVQGFAAMPGENPRPGQGVDQVPLVLFGDCRKAHEFPILLRQHVTDQIVPRVMPEGRLSCSRCMIRMSAAFCLSLRRE